MHLVWKKASFAYLDLLVSTRVEVLRIANGLSPNADMSEVERQSALYYKAALANDSHVAYLVFEGDVFAGAGGVSFFQVMPTYHNPTGRKAYIMNMYTAPAYRRQGVARKTLDLLVRECRQRGIASISLEATPMGRPLYESYGFVPMENEMELPLFACEKTESRLQS